MRDELSDSSSSLSSGCLLTTRLPSESSSVLADPTYTDKGLDAVLADMYCDQTISEADAVARRDGDHYGERLLALLPTATSYGASREYRTGKVVMFGETHVERTTVYTLSVHDDSCDMLAYGKGDSWAAAYDAAVAYNRKEFGSNRAA
jgi:hypothetical protein